MSLVIFLFNYRKQVFKQYTSEWSICS